MILQSDFFQNLTTSQRPEKKISWKLIWRFFDFLHESFKGIETLKSECEKFDGNLYTISLDITSQKSVDACHEYVNSILQEKVLNFFN